MKQKKTTMLLAILLMAITVSAQQTERFDGTKDKKEINGYTVYLVPAIGNTFGFGIIKGNRSVAMQLNNPFSPAPAGFKTKEDAFKLAEWVVNEYIKNGRPPQHFSQELAKQLNLSAGVQKN